MMGFSKFIVLPEQTILEAMKVIDIGSHGIVYICDESNILLGVLTDGDIRRYILKKGDLKQNVTSIMNRRPIAVSRTDEVNPITIMKQRDISSLPIINSKGELISIEFLHGNKLYKNTDLNSPVVIMAGGKGTRLLPYTQVLPKPLMPIGDKTITEHIINQFNLFGCKDISLIVNYKKELIKAYFKELNTENNINFIEEEQFYGTGGGLALLKGKVHETFFMTNCDVLINEDYSEILKIHNTNKNLLTIVCAVKEIKIPYGTIELGEDEKIASMKEKPSYSFITNTGFYVIEPEFLKKIPEKTFIHITDVIQNCLDEGLSIGIYPISNNSWLDMGEPKEMERMREKLNNE